MYRHYKIKFEIKEQHHVFSVGKYVGIAFEQPKWIELAKFPNFEQAKTYADKLNKIDKKCEDYNSGEENKNEE